MDFDKTIWGAKKFSDLLKDIYSNSKEKEKQIKELISTLKPFIIDNHSALTIVPLIANYLNISVKNDEQLIKLASIVQRAASLGEGDSVGGFILSEAEKEQLFLAVNDIGDNIEGPSKN